jgi:tetratricopeptide (TPR) repeat protein
MAEAKTPSSGTSSTNKGAVGAPADGTSNGSAVPSPVKLKNIWPIPTLVIAVGMLVAGSVVAFKNRPKPNPAKPFELAVEQVEHDEFAEGLEALNSQPVQRFLNDGQVTREQWGAFYRARARAIFGAQAAKGLSVAANYKTIVEDYEKARENGAPIEASDVSRMGESLIGIGEVEKALAVAKTLPESEGARRTRLFKQIVELNLKGENKREAMTLELLATLASDAEIPATDKAWVLARQSELLIGAGETEEAISKLIRRLGLLRDLPAEQQGELHVLLGRAYFQAEQPANALKQLEYADRLVSKSSTLRAEMGVMSGKIAQNSGDLEGAREKFQGVLNEFSTSPLYLSALLGVAEVSAAQAAQESSQSDQDALEKYSELVEAVKNGRVHDAVTTQAVYTSLFNRQAERFDSGDRESSLRYAMLAESLFTENQVPADLLKSIGRTQRAMGDQIMEQARSFGGPDFKVEDLDPTTRAEVKQHYMVAGDYLRRHALSIASREPSAYAQSLWLAADSFDRAGDLDEARIAFAQYADGASDNDPNKPASRFRLAQIFQARHDYAAAASLYQQLVGSRGAPGEPGGAGVWADQAIVPLARCLLQDGVPSNDNEAERLLLSVVDGSTMAPDAATFRDALIELGSMYYGAGKYPEAISWLEQAAKRYKDDKRIDAIRYRLADAHRLEAQRMGKALEGKMPLTQSQELEKSRTDHLQTARSIFQTVRSGIEAREGKRLAADEKVYLRNAYFYAGDCAFELKDYDGAIQAYDTARLKYAEDPASLVAMAQIVSAYVAQKRYPEARTANERAKQQLARFPDSVWSRGDVPMGKEHWERWLEARTFLDQAAQGETEPAPGR